MISDHLSVRYMYTVDSTYYYAVCVIKLTDLTDYGNCLSDRSIFLPYTAVVVDPPLQR